METKKYDVYVKTDGVWSGPIVLDGDALNNGAALPVSVKNHQCQVLLYNHDALAAMSEQRKTEQLEFDLKIVYPNGPIKTAAVVNTGQWRLDSGRVLLATKLVGKPVTAFFRNDTAWNLSGINCAADENGTVSIPYSNVPGCVAFVAFEGSGVTKTEAELSRLRRVETKEDPSGISALVAYDSPVAAETHTVYSVSEIESRYDTLEEIEVETVQYIRLANGTTNADLETMGLSVEDNMKTFRSAIATETFFADLIDDENEESEFQWVETQKTDRSVHDLFFSEL